jgi:hypothetical protein
VEDEEEEDDNMEDGRRVEEEGIDRRWFYILMFRSSTS